MFVSSFLFLKLPLLFHVGITYSNSLNSISNKKNVDILPIAYKISIIQYFLLAKSLLCAFAEIINYQVAIRGINHKK